MVIPRAIIRDLHTGVEGTRLMALVMLVISISPILAPVTGSGVIALTGWRGVFVLVTLAGILGLVMLAVFQPETRPAEARVRIALRSVVDGFGQLLVHGRFLGLTFIGGMAMASFFAFLASSSFVYIDHYGLTPTEYGVAFSVNAIGFFAATQFASRLGARHGMERIVGLAVSGYAACALVLFVLTAAGFDSLALLMVMLFLCFACLGLVIPTTMVLALDDHGPIAGMASALGGTLQMLAGALAIVVVGLLPGRAAMPMVTTIALCALTALIIALKTLRRTPVAPAME